MVLRNPEGGRRRVGGLLWVSSRLYPLVKAACPNHPLLRETRREVLEDVLDAPAAVAWLAGNPAIRFRALDGLSPFASAWIDPGSAEPLRYESPAEALRRLHARLATADPPRDEIMSDHGLARRSQRLAPRPRGRGDSSRWSGPR